MQKTVLWSASFTTADKAAGVLADVFGDAALSQTIVAPPRTGRAEIEAIFDAPPDAAALQTRMDILCALHGIAAPRLIIKQLPGLDWLKKVSEDFPPLPIARWVVYGAQHKQAAEKHHRIGLQIDATSAFGTGEHPTTRGCLLMLDWWLKKRFPSPRGRAAKAVREANFEAGHASLGQGWGPSIIPMQNDYGTPPSLTLPTRGREYSTQPLTMLDMGCGSGILAMAFVKAARGKAVGVDLDAASVEVAKDNIRVNGLKQFMRVELGNGYRAPLVRQGKPYDVIMANIFAGPLCKMAHDLTQHLRPGGAAILSGLLTYQARGVIAAHQMQELRLIRHLKIGEWSVLAFTRPARAE